MLKIRNQILFGFSIIIPLILLLGFISHQSLVQVGENYVFLVEHNLEVLQNAQKLQKLVVDAETGQRGYVITADEDFLDPYFDGVETFHSLMEIEKNLVSDNPSQIKKLETIENLFEQWNQKAAIPEIELTRRIADNPENKQKVIELIQQKTGKNLLDQMRIEFKKFIDAENDLKNDKLSESLLIESNTKNLILITVIVSIIFIIAISFNISSRIVQPLISLEKSMKTVGKNNFMSPSSEGSYEIKSLKTSFLSMLKQIEKTNDLEKQLTISNERIKNEKFTTLGLISSRLSHDLRNPLTVIKSSIDIQKLKDQDRLTDEDKKRYVRIEEAIQHMVHQIEGVLTYVQQKPLDMENTIISELIKNALGYIEIPSNVTVNLPTNDLQITCDKRKIEVVLYNIMSNAIQAMSEKGTLTIRIKQKNEFVVIEIEDSGQGVSDDLVSKVFDPLFTTKTLGTGLGLSTCKSIAEQHGGEITIQNKPSIFSIILPINLKSN